MLCIPAPSSSSSSPSSPSSSSSSSSSALLTPSSDRLDLATLSPSLVVHDFSDRHSPIHAPYTLVLNKYNTIPDHVRWGRCVCLSVYRWLCKLVYGLVFYVC
ncbi:hypothetical protein EON63_10215 [archaeon]|nr:MAG: hypothetical protein EON63_10215 [archaeon]